ncbi:MAG TPA: glycosyltransferase family 87 protein [Candidatus Omnitrophota bacterium]|nr:glycosyltransferase family 87 protein [Candidatus Omnitrophota bacterium]HRY85640.1 glycosyltransferase family 87 protein [Candidatus Omnitrophota bacterium]
MELVQKTIDFFLRRKWLGILLVASLALGVGISTFYRGAISPKQRTDLTVFLIAGEMVAEGRADHIYGIENIRHWHYVYPPILAILLAPISQWPLGVNVALAYLLSLACLAGTIMLSLRFKENAKPKPWQIVLAMLFCLPLLLNTLTRGQLGTISLFFAAWIFYAYFEQKKIMAGVLLALAVTLKISPLAFLAFFFLMKREWKILISAAAGFVFFFFVFPSFVIGFETNFALLKTWVELMSFSQTSAAPQHYLWGELFTPFTDDNQSIYATVTRLAWGSQEAFIRYPNHFIKMMTSAIGFILLALPFLKTKKDDIARAKDPLRSLTEFSLFLMIMLFASPVTQIHHYTVAYFLFLAALMTAEKCERRSWSRRSLWISMWLCAFCFIVGKIFWQAGEWGLPLWGSMLLWGVVLLNLPGKSAEDPLKQP